MKTILYIIFPLVILSIVSTSCQDDEKFAPIGTIYKYTASESKDMEDGTYIINNAGEYAELMNAPMPSALNIDFNSSTLVLVKGHETNGINDITIRNHTDANTYHINIFLSLNGFLPIEHWCIAIVMPLAIDPTVDINIERIKPVIQM